jgi:hypothetical protein
MPRLTPLALVWLLGCSEESNVGAPSHDAAADGDRPDAHACPALDDPVSDVDASVLTVVSDFENANAVVRSVDRDAGVVTIEPRGVADAGLLWWHFRLDGVVAGQRVTLEALNDKAQGESHPVFSYDRKSWTRWEQAHSPYSATFSRSSVWIARNHPYTWSRSLALACALQGSGVQALELTTSEQGRRVVVLRFSAAEAPSEGKVMVWVQARQHAWESHGSWVAEGLARWLATGAPEAAELLRRADVYVVPIMDVDNVFLGGTGKGQSPQDFNLCWGQGDCWNAVRAAIAWIDKERATTPLRAFVDLHSPGYNSLSSVGHLDTMTEAGRNYLEAFSDRMATANASIPGANDWQTNLWAIDSTKHADNTRAANWYAEAHWLPPAPAGLTVPIEVTHAMDPSGRLVTLQGLLDYGQALGVALGDHVAGAL